MINQKATITLTKYQLEVLERITAAMLKEDGFCYPYGVVDIAMINDAAFTALQTIKEQ